ncbi:hypothetical protein JW926_02925 [Candidatus Sumerlaeota bacterium]|nr:hypothetical protein [Candidatus Sumerlaeota bacterium]
MIQQQSLHKSLIRISVLTILGGTLVIYLSRFIPKSFLVDFARDLHFDYPIERWHLMNFLRKVDLFRDTAWYSGGGMMILGILSLSGHPARLRRFLEGVIVSRGRSLFFFFMTIQFVLVFMLLLTEYRFWYHRMYDGGSPGSHEQRVNLCGREYLHALYISNQFQPGDHVLLAGEQVDPFFLNYYLYPVYLYHYDNRPISEHEIYSFYVRRWLRGKNIKYILVYSPFSPIPWKIFATRNDSR